MQNTKNILSDFHHQSLLYSLILLFEKRLGYNLYRPIGMEWYEQDFWMVYPARDTAEQYLSLDQGIRPKDGSNPLNQIKDIQDDVYFVHDIEHNILNKAITLETFKKMPIDIVIASIPQHISRFKRLIQMYKPEAKLIYQIGNQWNVEGDVQNIMASARINSPVWNTVIYHQEFDRSIFDLYMPRHGKKIASFMNVPQNMPDYNLFLEMEKLMPDWEFKAYGGQGRDGNMNGSELLANEMANQRFIWHVKSGGDGYGHIIHNAAALGRPAIVKKSYYQGKLAEDLMIDGVTCVDIDGLSPSDIKNKIEHFNQEDRYLKMCMATYENFKAKVNFDKDAKSIVTFLSHLR